MNKNNLRRIAVFMAMMAASPQMKTSASIMLKYGGPGFWAKKSGVIEHKSDNKKFYKNPKIMVPAIAGGAAF